MVSLLFLSLLTNYNLIELQQLTPFVHILTMVQFASSDMTLPEAEAKLSSHLGDCYKDNDWQPALKAVMDSKRQCSEGSEIDSGFGSNMWAAKTYHQNSCHPSSTTGCNWQQTYCISWKASKQALGLWRVSHSWRTHKFHTWTQDHRRVTLCLSWWRSEDCWASQVWEAGGVWGDHGGCWWWRGRGARLGHWVQWPHKSATGHHTHKSAQVLINQVWWWDEHNWLDSAVVLVSWSLVPWRLAECKANVHWLIFLLTMVLWLSVTHVTKCDYFILYISHNVLCYAYICTKKFKLFCGLSNSS